MMAANYRHIGGLENRLGRHYSRFSASGPVAPLAAQSLARRKSRNGGANRRSWAKNLESIAVTNTYPGGFWENQGYDWFSGVSAADGAQGHAKFSPCPTVPRQVHVAMVQQA